MTGHKETTLCNGCFPQSSTVRQQITGLRLRNSVPPFSSVRRRGDPDSPPNGLGDKFEVSDERNQKKGLFVYGHVLQYMTVQHLFYCLAPRSELPRRPA